MGLSEQGRLFLFRVKNIHIYEEIITQTKFYIFGGNIMEQYYAENNTINMDEMVWCDGMQMTRAEAIEYMSNR
jgi:hypothetical protein